MTERKERWMRKIYDVKHDNFWKSPSEKSHHVTKELNVITGKISSGRGCTSAPENAHVPEFRL
jgi:hypothetical protein